MKAGGPGDRIGLRRIGGLWRSCRRRSNGLAKAVDIGTTV